MSRKIIEKNRDKILKFISGYVVKYAEEKGDDERNGNFLRGGGWKVRISWMT